VDAKFPVIPADLLDELDRRFPERSAELNWSDREVWLKAGERSVVRFLRARFDEQNETVIQR
jgi:hypothetical protein